MEHDDRAREVEGRLAALKLDATAIEGLMATGLAEAGRLEALEAATQLAERLAARGAIDDPEEAAALIRGVVECELSARRTLPSGLDRSNVERLVHAATEYPPPAERPTADGHALWITLGGVALGALGVILQIV
jgi:hypothetical protein